MSVGLFLYVALVIALSAVVGRAAESLCRQYGRPARWAWLAASAAALILVVRAVVAGPAGPVAVTYSRIALPAASEVAAPGWSPFQAVREALASSATVIGSAADAVVRVVPPSVASFASIFWIVTSLLALVVLVFVHLRIGRARRDWAEADLFGTRVRIAPDVGPAVIGVLRPQIVVPSWLLALSSDEQQLVLAHEREHLRARDHLLLAAGSMLVALVSWHPAAWWILSRLRLAIELDCDARVLRRGVPPRTYGTLLIDLADRCTGFRVGATALADEGSHLERRLLAMKTSGTNRSLLRAGVLGVTTALALLAACEAKVPTGPEIQAMDVASASKVATGSRLLQKTQMDSAIYFVDGKRVEASQAHSLMPNQIATIDINKGGAHPEIRIVTNDQAPVARGHAYKGSTRVTVRDMSVADTSDGTVKARLQGEADAMGNPLILIDGVKASEAQLHALDRNRIESVRVLKGAAAERVSSDPAAKNGIIEVTTKK